jgi:hypothetical protein
MKNQWSVVGGQWSVTANFALRSSLSILAVAVGLALGLPASASAQEPAVPKDDALDSLLEKLADPSDRDHSDQKPQKPASSQKDDRAGKKAGGTANSKDSAGGSSQTKSSGAKDEKAKGAKPGESPSLTGKDQEVDELLQKLGETTDAPSPEERPRGGAGGGEKAEGRGPSQKPDQSDRSRLSGMDKETDEHLEELTGRKRRKKNDDGERSGPAGQIIKEMRDIEQKLAKPDTGEGTREEQKKVVKQIETLIEEVRQSGQTSMGRIVMRRVRRQNQQGGKQPGSTEGAMARGAQPSKPLRPTSKHSTAGGKDVWGHLPDELRQEIENTSNEDPLNTKAELIDRYYLSVGKGKLVREETP